MHVLWIKEKSIWGQFYEIVIHDYTNMHLQKGVQNP
jgi:hypothetical protein